MDVVGLDTTVNVANIYTKAFTPDESRDKFNSSKIVEVLYNNSGSEIRTVKLFQMIRHQDGTKENWKNSTLTYEYKPVEKAKIQSAWSFQGNRWDLKKADQVSSKIDDRRGGEFYEHLLWFVLKILPRTESQKSLMNFIELDQDSKLQDLDGKLGPFETWDALGRFVNSWLRWKAAGEPADKWVSPKAGWRFMSSFYKVDGGKSSIMISEQKSFVKSLESKISSFLIR